MGLAADAYCRKIKSFLTDAFTVRWERASEGGDLYAVKIFANYTGDHYQVKILHDDFKLLDPEQLAKDALQNLFNKGTDRLGI